MAARANLHVDPELRDAFGKAQEGNQRYLVVKIKEERLVLGEQQAGTGDAKADFDTLVEKIGANEAAFILFQLDPNESRVGSQWLFVAFVPDSAPVRDKMMYASSTEDLSYQLGKDFFVSSYKCSEKAELSYGSWQASTRERSESNTDIMTAKEKLIREESLMDKSSCATGMKAVPFKMRPAVVEALAELKAGSRTCVEMGIDMKTEQVVSRSSSGGNATASDLASALDDSRPCYLVLTAAGKTVFVFLCPEGAKARKKMLYATAKKAVLDHCEEALGKPMDGKAEIGAAADLVAAVKSATEEAKPHEAAEAPHKLAFNKLSARPAARRRRPRGRRGLIRRPKQASPPKAPAANATTDAAIDAAIDAIAE